MKNTKITNKIREMPYKDFVNLLKDTGFNFIRLSGDHEIWKNEKGETFSFANNGKTVKAAYVWNFRRIYILKR